jgi:nucleotide-binding universal stress UspA family protein
MKLLLAVDDSECSAAAIREVARRPWPNGTQVRVLSVMTEDPGAPPPGVDVPSAPLAEVPPWPVGTLGTEALLNEAAHRIAQAAAEALVPTGLPVEVKVREGAPGAEIVGEARDYGADLIVVGSHGYGRIKRALLGSVASYVTNHAPCSVQVVKLDAKR